MNPQVASKLARIIRVDQAGELGADYIYAGQHLVFSTNRATRKSVAPLIKHMWQQEIHHRNTFDALQVSHRVRPSILTPMWKTAAFSVGVFTALLGKEAAMACTEAVETVIGDHYNSQLCWLHANFGDALQSSPDLGRLARSVQQFRDDELEHLDTAVAHDAHKAVPYHVITGLVSGGVRASIWLAERF